MSDTRNESDGPTITFGASAAKGIVSRFGWQVGPNGEIVDGEGHPVAATDGATISIGDLGGVVPNEDGEPTPLRDDFGSVVEWVATRGGR